jgi:multiple antibiotic resistance protein
MDRSLIDFALLAFTSIFTMVNPFGVTPIYTTMTSTLAPDEAKRVAFKAVGTAFIILLLFSLSGKFIFDFFNISVHGLRIVGGLIFIMTGYDMLQARVTRTKSSSETTQEYVSDIAITPIGIPLIAGPGAMTISIVLMSDANTLTQKAILITMLILVLVITLLFLLSGRKIIKFLGESGNKVLLRIMGLIVMVVAVEFIFKGLKPILRDILKIN